MRGLAGCVQVKQRAAEPGDADREVRWLNKVIAKGAKQAAGTIRSLRATAGGAGVAATLAAAALNGAPGTSAGDLPCAA